MMLSHFVDMSWYALLVSVVLAMMSRHSIRERVKYGVLSFIAFILIAIAIGWLMFPFTR